MGYRTGMGNKLAILYFANKPGVRITSPLVIALSGSDDIRHASQRHHLIRPLTVPRQHQAHVKPELSSFHTLGPTLLQKAD